MEDAPCQAKYDSTYGLINSGSEDERPKCWERRHALQADKLGEGEVERRKGRQRRHALQAYQTDYA